MSVPIPGGPRHADRTTRRGGCRWETIRYALDSTSRTVRLCAILLVASIPPCVIAVLVRR
jgi:hypothetical protein